MLSTCITSWADEAEAERVEKSKVIPSSFETIKHGEKSVTTYRINHNGKLEKITQTYKIESRRVPKSVINRKSWKKFGDCARDLPGPNSNNTFYGEEVSIYLPTCIRFIPQHCNRLF